MSESPVSLIDCPLCKREKSATSKYYQRWNHSIACNGCGFTSDGPMLGEPPHVTQGEIRLNDEEQLVADIAADICDTVSRLNGIPYTPAQWMGTARNSLKHFKYHSSPVRECSEISGNDEEALQKHLKLYLSDCSTTNFHHLPDSAINNLAWVCVRALRHLPKREIGGDK